MVGSPHLRGVSKLPIAVVLMLLLLLQVLLLPEVQHLQLGLQVWWGWYSSDKRTLTRRGMPIISG